MNAAHERRDNSLHRSPTQVLCTQSRRLGIRTEGIDDAFRHAFPYPVAGFLVWILYKVFACFRKWDTSSQERTGTYVPLLGQIIFMNLSVAILLLASLVFLYVRFLRRCFREDAEDENADLQ